jgi:lysophospholipase L1-like esterase
MKGSSAMRIAAFLLLLVAPALAQADEPFSIKDGDRVVFYGDSITDQRLYTTFVETYVVTRFPTWKVDFVHSGWGGDRVTGSGGGSIDTRLSRDVVAYKPTVVTIMLGMNDASYRAFDPKIFNTYSKGYHHIIDVLRRDLPDARLTLIRPSPYDDVTRPPNFEGGYNAVLVRYGDFVEGLARESHATVADLNAPVVEATKKAFASDPELAKKLNFDRIHPGPGGQLLMAAALLDAWKAPALVSSVSIDASSEAPATVREAKGAKVEMLVSGNGSLTWTETDDALPFPIDLKDAAVKLAVASSDVVQKLDQQTLKVTGLTKPEYTLKIDGKEVGSFRKETLAEGINLATLETPMVAQARQVHMDTLGHNKVHFERWRTVQEPYAKDSPAGYAKAIEGLDEFEAALIARQRKAARPKAHKYELTPRG